MTIIVDDDINLDDPKDVIWAMGTRCEPKTGTHIFSRLSSEQLDPLLPPEVREVRGTFEFSRIIINACRPYNRIKDFPQVNIFSEKWRQKVRQKWGKELFPSGRTVKD